MEFIKTHWSRLSIALLFLIGGALAIVCYIADNAFAASGAAAMWYVIVPFASAMLYFFGMLTIMILKAMLDKKCVAWIYIIIGTLVLLGNITAICAYPLALNVDAFWIVIVPLLVFGLYPLLKGITKFVESGIPAKPAPVAKP